MVDIIIVYVPITFKPSQLGHRQVPLDSPAPGCRLCCSGRAGDLRGRLLLSHLPDPQHLHLVRGMDSIQLVRGNVFLPHLYPARHYSDHFDHWHVIVWLCSTTSDLFFHN